MLWINYHNKKAGNEMHEKTLGMAQTKKYKTFD